MKLYLRFNYSGMWHTIKDTVLNPIWYIDMGGLYLLVFIIFAETGLFAGFFLPGDSLLVVAGMLSDKLSESFFNVHYMWIPLMFAIAGILGNMVGYWFGKKSGPYLYSRKDTFFFKKKHLLTAKKFYEKNGAFTVVAARFLPIIRTFVPIVAGVVKMDYKKYTLYNIVGSFLWVFSMFLIGKFARDFVMKTTGVDIIEHIELIVVSIVLVTTLPVILKFLLGGRKKDYNEDEDEVPIL